MSTSNSVFPNTTSKPSFQKGAARILDITASLDVYRIDGNYSKSDSEALKHDWIITGNDIAGAVKEYGKQSR